MQATVRLDFGDVVAALYLWVQGGAGQVEELAGRQVDELVALATVDLGLSEVSHTRDEIGGTPPGADLVLDTIRDRARLLLGPGHALTFGACGLAAARG